LILLDTNVLVYAYDPGDKRKQLLAGRQLEEIQPTRLAALSTQVLAEFFDVVTRRLEPRITARAAVELVSALAQSFATWPVDDVVVLEAARGVRDYRMSYWDAQVWATARLRGARVVLTEDFSDGQTLEGVTFRDPFAAGFNLQHVLS
jgi:predicted nucleic acid-binding protein